MTHGAFLPPLPENEPILGFAPGSHERDALKKRLASMAKETVDVRKSAPATRAPR